jgi:glycosyltransferase involved in cell wall biosynthesis
VRLTIIGPVYPLRGGIAHHVYWLHRELSARGHQVQVISYPRLLFPGTSIYDTSEVKLDAGARAILTALNPISWVRALKAARVTAPDLVVIQWWNTFFAPLVGTLGRMLGRAGLSTVIECHNVLPHERRWVDRYLLKFAFAPASEFITHSMADREELIGVLPDKRVRVAPLPILNEFSATDRPERKGRTILFFGIVRKYKGLDVLLRALPKVLSEVECNLIIAGEFYEPVSKYEEIVRELGLSSSVRIENRYIPNEDVPALFNQADVLVLPYLSATQSAVAGIAAANGLPIIASRTGGLSEAVQENVTGLLFTPGDVNELADRLVHYFTTSAQQTFIDNLNPMEIERIRSQLADVIEEIAAEQRGRADSRSALA